MNVVSRIAPSIDEKKGSILYYTHIHDIEVQLLSTYLDLCGKMQNKDIDQAQERALRVLLEDYTSSFGERLQKIDDSRVHVKSLRYLMIEIHKCLSCENSSFINNLTPQYIPQFLYHRNLSLDTLFANRMPSGE